METRGGAAIRVDNVGYSWEEWRVLFEHLVRDDRLGLMVNHAAENKVLKHIPKLDTNLTNKQKARPYLVHHVQGGSLAWLVLGEFG